MNLKDALLCLDCDEIFSTRTTSCNAQCPRCASSAFAPLSTWVQDWTTFAKTQDERDDAPQAASSRKHRIFLVRKAPAAA